MTNKVYVGNLSYDLTEEQLRDLFAPCGEIRELKIVKDFFTGKARGFGFVTFEKPEAAEAAVKMDGQVVNGRNLRVSFAQDRNRGSGSYYHGRGMSV
ncbi:MAG: RNA-binding protein [Bdellovibrionaceae bacterium]|nr:RNA-binding protein [Bdellovibrionales bacterium]MCB9082738.1 RNA-binding protein [Pseudobdellovibrionaceae bacterium]